MSDGVRYELRVAGHLDDHWSSWLDDLTISRRTDGTSALTGAMADQAQLHGLLARLRDVGAPLLSLRLLDAPGARNGSAAGREPTAALQRPVCTERLILRAARAEDAAATFAYRRLEPVGRWLTEIPADLESYRASFTEPARLSSTVVVELDGVIIGDFMLRIEDAWAQAEVADQARNVQAELGWVLVPACTGRGYATEAVRGLLDVCFEELGLRRVVANCFADNESSARLMERVGMRCETHALRESLHRSGKWLDTLTYAILAEEWRRA